MMRLTLALLLTAPIAAIIFANSIELPQPKPIDPNNMMKIEVVAPQEPVPVAGEIMDVGDLTSDYVHTGNAPPVPFQAPQRPVRERAVPVAAPVAREAPVRRQSDPLHYRRYVRESVRQEPVARQEPRVHYGGQQPPARIRQVDPDPYRAAPRTYYYAEPRYAPPPPPRYAEPRYAPPPDRYREPPPPPWRTEAQHRRDGCNAMASSWCQQNSRAREEYRDRVPEDRREDYFE